ncbi:MAG: hypothetical protein A2297_00285 [Elusimicrobia bacterium RIFOXYB2_FULL_48_7]|nr:MAG: hypothetical protein A2297_00285 [Elusimicrobia bacterium RIFOXYB2_FULL_48_7]
MELRGFHLGQSRQPLSESQRIDRAALSRLLQCILADFGYVEAPKEGCPPRTGNLSQDRINQIAATVIQTLRERGL